MLYIKFCKVVIWFVTTLHFKSNKKKEIKEREKLNCVKNRLTNIFDGHIFKHPSSSVYYYYIIFYPCNDFKSTTNLHTQESSWLHNAFIYIKRMLFKKSLKFNLLFEIDPYLDSLQLFHWNLYSSHSASTYNSLMFINHK